MPYIDQKDRSFLSNKAVTEVGQYCTNAGELNFVISRIVTSYFNRMDKGNYQAANDVVGALEGAKLEFYRRAVAPYEDEKIKINGDLNTNAASYL
jgi:hypothetical protein